VHLTPKKEYLRQILLIVNNFHQINCFRANPVCLSILFSNLPENICHLTPACFWNLNIFGHLQW